jgi:hypothetical protein
MGAAASTSTTAYAEDSSKRKGVASIPDDTRLDKPSAALIIDDDNDDAQAMPLFGATNVADDKPAGLSSNRLKKMALGIQGYKDQQRDYDDTLNTLDVHKSAEKLWSEPKAEDSSAKSPTRKHGAAPTTPVKSTEQSAFFGSPPTAGHVNRTTPLHTPYQSQYGSFTNKSSEKGGYAGAVYGNAVQLDVSNNNNNNNINNINSASSSFSRGSHSASGYMPHVMPPLNMGPPQGIPTRPIPRQSDPNENMYATFAQPLDQQQQQQQQLQKQQFANRHQHIPNLNLTGNALQTSTPPQRMAGFPSTSGPSTPLSFGGPRPFGGQPKSAPFPGGSPPPRGMGPRGSNFPAAGFGSRPGSVGASPVAPIPVVKETTVVKRNKVDLPTNLNHAKPTAGDWLNKRYFVNNYILLDTLGVGSYGEVSIFHSLIDAFFD